jgi:hypothetical protein
MHRNAYPLFWEDCVSPQNKKLGFSAKGCPSSPHPSVDNETAKYEAVYLHRPINRSVDSAYRRLSIFSAPSSYARTMYADTCSISRFSVLRRVRVVPRR